MINRKLKVAVTGGIGGGKSLFCKYIAEKGFPVFSADDISKELLVKNKEVKEKIIKKFGKESYSGGKLNKKYLGDKVFSSPEEVKKINSIVHPVVISEINNMMKDSLKTNSIVFVEAALIFEAKMQDIFDYVVLITADEEIRKKRLFEKGITEGEFEKRSLNQIPDEKKRKRSDFIFENNGTEEELKQKVNIFLKIVTSTAEDTGY